MTLKKTLLWLPVLVLLFNTTAWSDDSQPLYIEITELSHKTDKHYQVQWRLPATLKAGNTPQIELPAACQLLRQSPSRAGALKRKDFYQCTEDLAGDIVTVNYPRFNPSTSTLIKFHALSGEQHTRLLSPSESQWVIPLQETLSRIARDYTVLGVQHIWAGTDHLLFVLCLLWIAGSWRRVLITITGFTVAHSMTLVLSALQWVRLPVAPVEALIALSVVFLATEIAKDKRHTLTWRYPIAVSSSFGLLHGFGFAAALAEIGLPQTELVTGLLFFNVGVEIGQVLFALVVLSGIALMQRFLWPRISHYKLQTAARLVPVYCIGGLAAYWFMERSAGIIL